jgi:hypothetical protein
LIPLSVAIFTKPSFGRDEYDKETASTTKTKQEKSWSIHHSLFGLHGNL